MFCSNCGGTVSSGAIFCPGCGAKQGVKGGEPSAAGVDTSYGTRDQVRSSGLVYPKNPPLSPHFALLTVTFPGLPQIIFGQTLKGFALLVAFLLSLPTAVGPMLILVASLIDAYKVGYTLKAGVPVKKWQFFPSSN